MHVHVLMYMIYTAGNYIVCIVGVHWGGGGDTNKGPGKVENYHILENIVYFEIFTNPTKDGRCY